MEARRLTRHCTADEVRLQPTGSNGVTFVVGYASMDSGGAAVKNNFWLSVSKAVDEVPSGKHVVVIMDDDARTCEKDNKSTPSGVMGAYGRDRRNDNRRKMIIRS